jgi:hypothetical protein
MQTTSKRCYLVRVVSKALVVVLFVSSLGGAACTSEWVPLGRIQTTAGTTGASTTSANGGTRDSSATEPVSAGGNAGSATQASGGAANNTTAERGGAAGEVGFTAPDFGDVLRVPSLASPYEDSNPTLTSNLLELYFSSKNRPGGKGNVDVWVAKRTDPSGDFSTPVPVLEVSTAGIDSSPAIEADGLTLWVGSEPASGGLGGYDIMQSTRASTEAAFDAPVLVSALSSDKDDIPRPLGAGFSTMPLASRRDSEIYLTYFAVRSSKESTFDEPVLRPELIAEGKNVADGFLTHDGLTLYFTRSADDSGDLFIARRSARDEPFVEAIPLSTINTPYDDRDPWLSPDGTQLYFASDRDTPGTLNIYHARLVSP